MTFDLPGPLGGILARVSRSFGLSLTVLPRGLRHPVALAYLLARAADTIADTRLLPRDQRLDCLDGFLGALDDPTGARAAAITAAVRAQDQHAAEQELLRRLPECVAVLGAQPADDAARIVGLLRTLVHGMRVDLQRFPGDSLVALETQAELEEYTYYAAGCVGEFWTDMAMAHCPALAGWHRGPMAALGRRFGQGLQTTNILRDLAQDLRIGRCYLPRQKLAGLGLAPEDLLGPPALARLRPLLAELLEQALALHAEGWSYLRAIPPTEARLRLACAWPLLIGLRTLERIRRTPDLLDARVRVKVSRPVVYGILGRSLLLVRWDAGLSRYYGRLRRRVLAAA